MSNKKPLKLDDLLKLPVGIGLDVVCSSGDVYKDQLYKGITQIGNGRYNFNNGKMPLGKDLRTYGCISDHESKKYMSDAQLFLSDEDLDNMYFHQDKKE